MLPSRRGGRVHYPEPALCTDNGAMIAFAGALRLAAGESAGSLRPRSASARRGPRRPVERSNLAPGIRPPRLP